MSLANYKTKTAANNLIKDIEECLNDVESVKKDVETLKGNATLPQLDNLANVPVDTVNNMADEVKTAVAFNKLLSDLKSKGYMAKDKS